MKKYLAWILAALCALMPVAGLAAENRDTQLTTTLPREHTITVVCGAGGAVRVEGTVYTGTRTFIVDRLSAFTLEAVPDAGYQFSQVEAQPSSGVSISGTVSYTHLDVYKRQGDACQRGRRGRHRLLRRRFHGVAAGGRSARQDLILRRKYRLCAQRFGALLAERPKPADGAMCIRDRQSTPPACSPRSMAVP